MNALRAMSDGLRTPRKTLRIVAFLYVVNLVVAGLPALALHDSLVSSYGESQIASSFASGFDFTAFSDLVEHHGESLRGILQLFPKILLLSFLLNALLTGGVLRAITSGGNDNILWTVMAGVGEFAGRFLRLLALVVILAVVVTVFIFALLYFLWGAVAGDPTDEVQAMTGPLIGVAGAAIALWIVTMLADYSRVRMVLNNDRSVIRSFHTSVKFVLRQPAAVMVLQILLLGILATAGVLYVATDGALSMSTGQVLFSGIALQQVFIVARLWIRVVTSGSQIALMRQRDTERAEPAMAERSIEAYRSRL